MQTEHPLTDEICDQIQDSVYPCDPENMRAAADWQLEQCLEFLRTHPFHELADRLAAHAFAQLMEEAMRPIQENNS